jgi:hypothetical protein
MSKSKIRRKQAADTTRIHIRALPASPTYKEGPPGRANGCATQDAQEDKIEGPPVCLLEKNEPGEAPPGSTDPWGRSTRGGVATKAPDYLPYGRWRELASNTINRASLSPSQHTHTHFIPHCSKEALPLLLLG